MQAIARRPLYNLKVIGAIFGESLWEDVELKSLDREGFRIGPLRSWWTQFQDDLEDLFRAGECLHHCEQVRARPVALVCDASPSRFPPH